MQKFRHLDAALKHLYNEGVYDDFTKDGLPKLSAVKKIYDGLVDRQYVDRCWRNLFGYSTFRKEDDV